MRHYRHSDKRRSSALLAKSGTGHEDIRDWATRFLGANWLWNGVILGCICSLLVADMIKMAISTGIQLILLGILDHAAFFQHHHRRTRQPSALYGSVRHRRRWKGSQLSIGSYEKGVCPICSARAESLGHMIFSGNLTDTHCGELGKRRLLYWMTRILDDDKTDRCRKEERGRRKTENKERRTTNVKTKENEERNSERANTTTENNEPTTNNYRISIYQLPTHLQTMPDTGSADSTGDMSATHSTPTTTNTIHTVMGMMPRPGQPGALLFDGKKVTRFLKDWSLECEEYGLTDDHKCKKLPKYCTEDIGEVVERMTGYTSGDWTLLQSQLKSLFWKTDPPKDTGLALSKLIDEAKAGKVSIEMYVLKYTVITEALVKQNAMSNFERYVRLLHGLPEKVQSKVFKHGCGKGWKMMEHDVATEEPKFDDVKSVVLEKAQMVERREMFVNGGHARFGSVGLGPSEPSSTPVTSTTVSTVPTAISSPVPTASDPMGELTKQLAKLTLFLEGQPRQQSPVAQATSQRKWDPRCMWCDSMEHTQRGSCTEYKEALDHGLIGYNDKGRIKLMATGEELPSMYGKGGMKALVQSKTRAAGPSVSSSAVATADVTAITFDDESEYGSLGSSVRVAALEGEDWIGVDVDEKRKGDFPGPRRRVRPRVEESQQADGSNAVDNTPEPRAPQQRFGYPPPVQVTEVPDEDMSNDVPRSSVTLNPTTNKPKFRLASELSQTVTTEDVGRKVMEAPIQLKMCELLAVSSEVSNFIHDQTRRRRIPIMEDVNAIVAQQESTSVDANSAQLSTIGKSLYACPSARAKVLLNDDLQVEALLDDGSELNLMGKGTYERLQHPIDSDINWRVNGYDSGAEQELAELNKKGNLIGVCHDVLVDVGGVVVKQHVFVVNHLASTELILGHPWERMTRAQKTNMDDGSYRIKIKSLDGRRIVEFVAVSAQHDRIREYVRLGDKPGALATALKELGVRQ